MVPFFGPALEVGGVTYIRQNNVIEFGYNVLGKYDAGAPIEYKDAGLIGYGIAGYSAGNLDIVGGGTAANNRIVSIYDKLEVNGILKVGKTTAVIAKKVLCWTSNKTIGYCVGPVNATGECSSCTEIN